MSSGDTLFAARRGTVWAVCSDAVPIGTHLGFNLDDNLVEINHPDCSFAIYTVFRLKGIFVELGQFVEVGTPLGVSLGAKTTILGRKCGLPCIIITNPRSS